MSDKKLKLKRNKINFDQVDQDGDNDLFIGGATGFEGKLYYNLGNGKFKDSIQPSFSLNARSEDMGALFFDSDMDGDGRLDIITGNDATENEESIVVFFQREKKTNR